MKRIILLLISAFVLACSVMTIVGGKETDNFIKYAEFNVTADALQKAVSYDVSSQSEDTKLNYIEILSYLGAKYGGDFSKYKQSDMDNICEKLKDGKTIAEINNTVCKGCGMCAPVCEPDAINLIGCSSKEIMSMIDALS